MKKTESRHAGLTIQRMPFSKMAPHPHNPRVHPPKGTPEWESLRASLVESYFDPLVLNRRNGMLVSGHYRRLVMMDEGFTSADVVVVDWDEPVHRARMIAANQLAGHLDEEKYLALIRQIEAGEIASDLTGLTEENIRDILAAAVPDVQHDVNAEPRVDEAKALLKKWKVKRGQRWKLGDHQLVCGDATSREELNRLDGTDIELVFTSPPYAVGVDYGEYQDTIENLRAMLPKLSKLWRDIVKPGGFAVINFGDIASGREMSGAEEPCEYPMALEYWPIFRADGWLLWSRRVWCKPNPRVHSLQCIGSNRAATDWENVWTWKRPGKPIMERVDGEHRSCLGWIDTTKEAGVEVGKETHGAGMATAIADKMILIHSHHGALIHEPFCGTGTTLIAAQRTGRKCLAMELEPKFCAVTLQRFEDATGIKPALRK